MSARACAPVQRGGIAQTPWCPWNTWAPGGTRRRPGVSFRLSPKHPPSLPWEGPGGPRVVGRRLLTSYHTEAKEVGFSDAGQVAHLLEELVPGSLHLR